MSDTEQKNEADGPTFSDLREQIVDYLSSTGQRLIGKATDKLTELGNPANGDGNVLANAGARIFKGENPVKAFIGEKASDVKDKVVGKTKEAVGMDTGSSQAGDVKAINIIEHIDIGVPLRQVYNQWTQLEDFSTFTNGVSSVSIDDEDETKSN